ncbi:MULTISPECIES: VVA0879 family protein [Asaia]|uniref:VVA0879 family protein n=1 Tax=Asaia TaxID=91914 RepID=UPI002FC2CF38
MRKITLDEFLSELKNQGQAREDAAFVCPMCGTVQSAKSLIAAGAGNSFEEVETKLGYSCVGRWLGSPAPRKKPDGKPCNWTLGGLFRLHALEVTGPDGKDHPFFEIATIEQAERLAAIGDAP